MQVAKTVDGKSSSSVHLKMVVTWGSGSVNLCFYAIIAQDMPTHVSDHQVVHHQLTHYMSIISQKS